jgi:hypothetical protein
MRRATFHHTASVLQAFRRPGYAERRAKGVSAMSDQRTPEQPELREEAHGRLRSMLPAYAIERLQGEPDPREWQLLTRHLTTCAACREELEELLLLLNETAMGGDSAEPDIPAFDLGALPPFSRRDQGAGWQAPPPAARPSAHELLIDLGAILLQAMSRPQLAGAFRQNGTGATGAPGEFHHQISVGAPDPIDIGLDFALSDRQRSLYRLQVTVVTAGDPFEQGGHAVTLRYEGHSAAAITDERGCVVFSGVPHAALDRLQISVLLHPPG